jgi:putative transposase
MEIRAEKGKLIAQTQDQVTRLDDSIYKVHSQTSRSIYEIVSTERGWACQCADHRFRGVKCKHIWAVEFSFAIRKEVVKTIEPVKVEGCLCCGSLQIVKDGIRHNKSGAIQIFNCKSCGRYFTINIGFEKMKHNPQAITAAMQLYFSGESLRHTQKSLELLGVHVTHKTVYTWINKYVSLMQKYLDKIIPQVGNVWRTDELFVKVRGNMKYLFALMDDETRFWIAQQVAAHKATSDVRPLFKDGKRIAGKKPDTLISDGAANFHEAYIKEFYTNTNPKTKHIQEITLTGKIHNQKMERMNGEVRDREKVIRGLKKDDTPILKGYQIFHNYLRPHEGLEGKTPAQACGIEVEGANKWITLIQNASHPTKVNTDLNPTER